MTSGSLPSAPVGGRDGFTPVPVVDLELTAPASVPSANELGQVLALVRLHGEPLGTLSRLVPADRSEDLYRSAVDEFRDVIVEHLALDGEPTADLLSSLAASATTPCTGAAPGSARLVSVVVCTLGQDARLVGTVESILGQSHDQLELIVVDNDPASGRAAALLSGVTDPRLRIVTEARRGLSVARNTGWAAATSPLVAYTDDDAVVDPRWLTELIQPFDQHPAVACVTGLVLPAELSTPAQLLFEEFGAFDKGFRRTVWSNGGGHRDLTGLGHAGEGGALFPYSAGVFGSGNNMAFRVDWLSRHGGFDVALGAGTLSRGGEDLDAFLDVMLSDAVIVYQPRAIVRHFARADMPALRGQLYGYGSGMSAVIAKHLVSSPRAAMHIAARLPAGLRKLLDPASDKNAGRSRAFPRELVHLELRGYLAGPVLYVRSRIAARRSGHRSAPRAGVTGLSTSPR